MIEVKIDLDDYPTVKTIIVDTDEDYRDENVVELTEFLGNKEEFLMLIEDLVSIGVRMVTSNRRKIYSEIRNCYGENNG